MNIERKIVIEAYTTGAYLVFNTILEYMKEMKKYDISINEIEIMHRKIKEGIENGKLVPKDILEEK